jgi:hypothetical protein
MVNKFPSFKGMPSCCSSLGQISQVVGSKKRIIPLDRIANLYNPDLAFF